jgi:hypothetical protein
LSASDTPGERDWQATTEVPSDQPNAERGTFSYSRGIVAIDRVGPGIGWGRKSLTQRVNETVKPGQTLRARVSFAILEQELLVCGSEGSECPFYIAINYTTRSDGTPRSWRQGFYARGVPEPDRLPSYLKSNRQDEHVRVILGQPDVYETENLLAQIPDVGAISDITVYAEGHTLRTQIYGVELLLANE